jgi:CarD family transcriptional regulator
MAFKAGDTILYAGSGVCKIECVTKKDLGLGEKNYYVMKPVSAPNSTLYVPADNEALTSKIRRLLSQEEIDEIISSMPDMEVNWIENDNIRKDKYREIIKESDVRKLVKLTKSIYNHKKELLSAGKKLRIADENFMREAESIIFDEFSEVLNINRDKVLDFIIGKSQEA